MVLASAVAAAVLFALVFYWNKVYVFVRERLRLIKYVEKIPGPYSVPIIGTTWQFKWNIAGLAMQMRNWGIYYASQGHGLVRFWLAMRPMVGCIRPETAKLILERYDLITKGEEYNILMPWLGTGLLISTGEKWRSRRKILTPSFHFKVLNEFLVVHDSQAKKFVDQLEKFASSEEEFDIFPYIKRCALDIICETAMGCHVSSQENHNHPYVASVQRMNELAFLYTRMPWMWIQAIWYASTYGLEYDRNLKIVTDFTRKVIDEKIAERKEMNPLEPSKKKAFLDLLLDVQAEGNLSYEDIREEVDTFMFEGHDTTSSSMGWTLWFLAQNPDCQRKVHEEMDEIFGASDRSCTSDDLKLMKYTEKCIKESLRLRPPVPNISRKVETDIEIDGTMLPKGCSVLISPYMIHCNPMVYENPFVFDPERFNEENVQKRHPYAYIPFSAGPRNCIGQKFAIFEEKTVLSWFFRRYSIGSRVAADANIPLPEIILKPSLGFPVFVSNR